MAVAEQLYDALTVWADQGSLEVTSTSLAFFQQFSSSITPGTYSSSSSQYSTLTSAIKSFADGFVAIHAEYTPSGGGLAEQYSKTDGTPVSAVDLTWSYAAALTGFAARSGSNTESWGAAGLSVPSTCSGNSGPTVEVTFNVDATTVFGGESSRSSANVLLGGWMAYYVVFVIQRTSTSPAQLLRLRHGRPITLSCYLPQTTLSGAVCVISKFSSYHERIADIIAHSYHRSPSQHGYPVQVHTQRWQFGHLGV